MQDLYKKLDQLDLEQQIVYPKSPIICYESSSRCYVGNPHLGKLDKYPNSFVFKMPKDTKVGLTGLSA